MHPNTEDSPLTPQQEQAIAVLLTHPTRQAAATAVGVAAKTLARWQQEPAFAAAYREARRDVLHQATQRAAAACMQAVETLTAVLTEENASASSRLRAAKMILDYAQRALMQDDFAARLLALEGGLVELRYAASQPRPPYDPDYALTLQTSAEEEQRLLVHLEAEMQRKQQEEEAHQREVAERKRRMAESQQRWEAYAQAIGGVSDTHWKLIQEAWKTIGPIWFYEQRCEYLRPGPWQNRTPGQRLVSWLLDRYEDYCAGQPVLLGSELAEAVIQDEDGQARGYCYKCQMRLPRRIKVCPNCKNRVST